MINFRDIMKNLAATRPVFHSEADFQFALAWEIQKSHPTAKIRLEWRPPQNLGIDHVDIFASFNSQNIGIELKYKTRAIECVVDTDHFILKNQSAQDIGRYDFLADVSRLEALKRNDMIQAGFAVFLTNDKSYWVENRGKETVDRAFRIGEGTEFGGTMRWAPHTGEGTKRGRENPIHLINDYTIAWSPYENSDHNPILKYLMVAI